MVDFKEILFSDMNLVWELHWPVWLTSQSIPRLTWSSFGRNLWGVTSEARSSSVVPETSNRRDSISCLDNCNKPQYIQLYHTVDHLHLTSKFPCFFYKPMFYIQSIWMTNICLSIITGDIVQLASWAIFGDANTRILQWKKTQVKIFYSYFKKTQI